MINKELWVNILASNLYDISKWYKHLTNWDKYIKNNVLHIPQKNNNIGIEEIDNLTGLPMSTNRETFSDFTVNTRIIIYGPGYILLDDEIESSFSAKNELLKSVTEQLSQAINIAIGYDVLTVEPGSIVPKTGTTRNNIYGNTGVESLTYQDILDARKKLSTTNKNVDLNNIYMLVDPFQYADILKMDEFTAANELGSRTVVSGFVGEVAGIKILHRASGLAVVDNAGTWEKPAAIDYADGYDATHHSAALMFDSGFVAKAEGTSKNGGLMIDVKPYEEGYYSDVIQAHSRVVGTPIYKPVGGVQKGIVSII